MSQPLASLLPNRGALILGGADRHAFLQGLVSNDVNAVGPSSAIYAALLSPQGKFLHDMFIIEVGDHFLLDCEAARADDLVKRFTAHKLRAKIAIENVTNAYDVWAAWDEISSSFPRKRESSASDSEHITYAARRRGLLDPRFHGDDIYSFFDPRLETLGTRIVIKKGTQPENICAAKFEAYDKHRITLGVPDGSRDFIVGKSTLAEGNLDFLNGISFTKGCYMGQELTARLHHRGLVKRRMFPVKITGKVPEFGGIIRDGADDVGDMRSTQNDIGLALLDIKKAQPQKTFTCGDSQLLVLDSFQKA